MPNHAPEGLRVAWHRFRWNVTALTDREHYYTSGERKRAWGDLGHSYVNVHVEAAREVIPTPLWLPKWLGKALVVAEIAAPIWLALVLT